jgi:hypothetical protein
MLRQSIFSVCLFITASGATAQHIDPFFPMVGGSMGEIMRLNVNGPADPDTKCVAEIGFRNAQGLAVGPSRRVELAPDHAAFLDLNLNTLVSRLGGRLELRGWLRHAPYSGPCAPSVELFEHITARTMVAQAPSFHPPPDPDLPPVGGARPDDASLRGSRQVLETRRTIMPDTHGRGIFTGAVSACVAGALIAAFALVSRHIAPVALVAAAHASGQGSGSPQPPSITDPIPLDTPYGVSVSVSGSINLSAAEVQSTVVGPGTPGCQGGRLLISSDNSTSPAQVALVDLNTLAVLGNATFDVPPGWGDTRRILAADHDLVALPKGEVLLVKMGQSKRPLDPKPSWFDFAFKFKGKDDKISDVWGPGARSEMHVWWSSDCGTSFQFVSAIDTAAIPTNFGFETSWEISSGGLPQFPSATASPGTPEQPIWKMGGTDGPLTRVDPATGRVFVTLGIVGHYRTAYPAIPFRGYRKHRTE